ncbi:5-dehydro-2-deoxygluconokinase [Cupriavidus gilardii]|uniref:5-dehydro-2-deoxygluconokinase n=1 Tax=Cupriavidus gilardii TaxID=82541 RepID=A0ABY4VIQ2_9BURK|nr:5-dehydro-2-deoxygluconokinase [Cupriavidus gilardii]MCT9117620.1 5-dehydro-2-deoxygluconokinase [Cupriavidus gilardii]MCT9126878.1 5-dehydro-2-deoxygluconokinase [Cupriavidus gilardii]USE76841.1 5-dehydro-2-deoxygluconokinase [Cupriavidus gilardii]UXC37936.1 5-dehydro-2-deoxygluconokinase [Cupriavidus gilardii]
MRTLPFPDQRDFDVACLGRLAVDLYAQQIGCTLEAASTFAKYLGGSSANIAFGTARLGLRSAMISRVGNEQNGRFLLETLRREGCDVSQVQIDDARLTGMVLLGIKDQDTFPLLFARENCADMALDAEAIDAGFLARCRSLVITGTHLSTPGVLAASRRALEIAGRHGVVRVLDIDYRPVLWGLTGKGDGETRYIGNAQVSRHLQAQLGAFELIIGTEEEWLIAGGAEGDLMASLRQVRACTHATLVIKRGPLGCSIVTGEIPPTLDDALTVLGERVEVLNVLGAGDAFASGLLAGLLRGKDWRESAAIANACGAIVVSRHGCAPAMPTPAELAHWFSGHRHPRPDRDPTLAHLHRVSAPRQPWPQLYVLAYDHRSQFEELAREAGADVADIPRLKRLINDVVAEVEGDPGCGGKIGVLIDGRLGESALHQATGRGWWVGRPIELPGSRPLRFDGTRSLASELAHWPREQVVKCLVFYHPDDPAALRAEQDDYLQTVWEATRHSGHELLLEVIPPKDTLAPNDRGEAVVRAIRHFYDIGLKPEWWKVGAMSAAQWQALDQLVQERDPWCRGAVILGLNQPLEQLLEGFAQASSPLVKGFMIGRSVWAEASLAWLRRELDDDAFRARVAGNFRRLIAGWRSTRPGQAADSAAREAA